MASPARGCDRLGPGFGPRSGRLRDGLHRELQPARVALLRQQYLSLPPSRKGGTMMLGAAARRVLVTLVLLASVAFAGLATGASSAAVPTSVTIELLRNGP